MPFSFDSTVQGASANSYVSESDFATYMGGRLDIAEYTAAATATIQAALAMATARLETESWLGSPTTTAQRLSWPRAYVPHQHWADTGFTVPYYGPPVYDSATIPESVKQACYELALMYLKDSTQLADTGLEGFEQVSVGPIDVTPRHAHKAGSLPAHVCRLLRGIRSATGGSVPVIRG